MCQAVRAVKFEMTSALPPITPFPDLQQLVRNAVHSRLGACWDPVALPRPYLLLLFLLFPDTIGTLHRPTRSQWPPYCKALKPGLQKHLRPRQDLIIGGLLLQNVHRWLRMRCKRLTLLLLCMNKESSAREPLDVDVSVTLTWRSCLFRLFARGASTIFPRRTY